VGTPSTLDDDAYDSDDAEDTIEEKFDAERQRAYFVNKKTGQTGWNKEAVRRKHSMMQTLAKRMPALRSQIAEDTIDENDDDDEEDDDDDAEEQESVLGAVLRRVSQSVLPLVATGEGSGLGAGSMKTVEVRAAIENPSPANCGINFQLQGTKPQVHYNSPIHSPHTLLSYAPLIHSSRTLLSYTPLSCTLSCTLSYSLAAEKLKTNSEKRKKLKRHSTFNGKSKRKSGGFFNSFGKRS
jgi:hypothetical protein